MYNAKLNLVTVTLKVDLRFKGFRKPYFILLFYSIKGKGMKKTFFGMLLSFVLIVLLVSIQSMLPVSVLSKTLIQEHNQNGEKLHLAGNTIKLILETDKSIYVLGENVTITLKNIGDEKINVGGYPPWQIFTYPANEPVYPKIFAFLAWSLEPGQSDTYVWNQYDDFRGEFCKPGKYVVRDTQGWNLSAYFEIMAVGAKIVNTGAQGMAPKVYGNIIAFFTDENFAGEDLNDDGDSNDLIIRYYNISSQDLTNTKVSGHYPAIYKNIITFTGSTVRYLNLTDGSFVDTGVSAFVDIPSIYGNIITFPTYEVNANMDLNGDGDKGDSVIMYYDLATKVLTNTGVVGWGVSIYGDIIAFSTFESQVGQDLNADGDMDDSVIRYYNISSGTVVNTRAEGWWPTLYKDIIAFEAHYRTYTAITYYNISDGSLVDTKIDGRMACVYGSLIVFSTPEADYGVGDLNGDGDSGDWVIRYYDVSTKTLVNLGVEGINPSIYENTIAFETYEKDAAADLNNDGDMNDHVIRYALLTPPEITATVKIFPNVLNLQSMGRWITAFIELPEGYNVQDINITTILLNNTIPAMLKPTAITDHDDDGTPELMIKFERRAVITLILQNSHAAEKLENVTLTITGYINDGTPFQGHDAIRVIMHIFRSWRFIQFMKIFPP